MKLACCVVLSALVMPIALAQRVKTIQVDESFHGREVVLRSGDELQVSLPENGSTGYQWSVAAGPKQRSAAPIRERKQTVEASSGPPGSPGRRQLFFEAVRPGSMELELDYRRVWEKDVPPARRFKLRIVVRRSSGR